MKHSISRDFFAAQRARQFAREQREPFPWDVAAFVLLVLLVAGTFGYWAWGATSEDFTDTGVGCIEDCLEPAESQVTPIRWEA